MTVLKMPKIVLTQLKMMKEEGPQSVLLDIVSRLQPNLQKRWQKRALVFNDSKDAYPEFSDLCDFLSAASKHSSNPVYGYLYMKKYQNELRHCSKFRQMSPRERLALVEQHRLCHDCLLCSHDTQSCNKNSVCLVQGESLNDRIPQGTD